MKRVYPGTEITKHDYYADGIAECIEIAEQAEIPSQDNPVVNCMRRVSRECGLQREIEVPLPGNVILSGRLDRGGVLFVARPRGARLGTIPMSESDVQALIALLHRYNLKVEVDYRGTPCPSLKKKSATN